MIDYNNSRARLASNQDGIVAITVTLLIMLVLTLLVTGFAQLARREQREALDRQLATQALFAAESGINEGKRLIAAKAATDPNYEKTSCDEDGYDSSLDGQNISITCLLIKQKLPNYTFQTVLENRSVVTPIVPEDRPPAHTFDRLVIYWQVSDGGRTVRADNEFGTKATSWGSSEVGMLRLEVIPFMSATSPQDSVSLRNGMFTFFARPKLIFDPSTDGAVDMSDNITQQGKLVNADCTNATIRKCRVVITGLTSKNYYLRFSSIYNPSDVYICPGSIASGSDCDENIVLTGGQSEIDSTGRATDVLKRIKERFNKDPKYNGSLKIPEFNIDTSESLCKLYSVWPDGSQTGSCPNTTP